MYSDFSRETQFFLIDCHKKYCQPHANIVYCYKGEMVIKIRSFEDMECVIQYPSGYVEGKRSSGYLANATRIARLQKTSFQATKFTDKERINHLPHKTDIPKSKNTRRKILKILIT